MPRRQNLPPNKSKPKLSTDENREQRKSNNPSSSSAQQPAPLSKDFLKLWEKSVEAERELHRQIYIQQQLMGIYEQEHNETDAAIDRKLPLNTAKPKVGEDEIREFRESGNPSSSFSSQHFKTISEAEKKVLEQFDSSYRKRLEDMTPTDKNAQVKMMEFLMRRDPNSSLFGPSPKDHEQQHIGTERDSSTSSVESRDEIEASLLESLQQTRSKLFNGYHMIRYDAIKTFMTQRPHLLIEIIQNYITNRAKETSCDVTNAFICAASNQFRAYAKIIKNLDWTSSSDQIELRSMCPSMHSIWMMMLYVVSKKKRTEAEIDKLEDEDQFTFKILPNSSIIRDLTKRNPFKMLKLMTNKLRLQDGSDFLHSERLEKFRLRRQFLLDEAERWNWSILRDWDQMEMEFQRRILMTIAYMFHALDNHMQIGQRRFYDSEKSEQLQVDNLPATIELEWLLWKSKKTMIDVFQVLEAWLKPKLDQLKSEDEDEMKKFNAINENRSKCLNFVNNTPSDELSNEQILNLVTFSKLTYFLVKAFESGKTIVEIQNEEEGTGKKQTPHFFMRSPEDLTGSNVKLNVIEQAMVSSPMGVLERLKECITEKSATGVGEVKNAFLRNLTKRHSKYVDIVKMLDPKQDKDKLLHLSRSVYFSLDSVIHLPFNDTDCVIPVDNIMYQELELYNLWNSTSIVFYVANYPLRIFYRMTDLLMDEDVSPYLSHEDHEEYCAEKKAHLKDCYNLDQHNLDNWNSLDLEVKRRVLDKIVEMHHTFGVFHARGRAAYLKTEKSKDPFEGGDWPDDFQFQWLLQSDFKKVFKTYEGMVGIVANLNICLQGEQYVLNAERIRLLWLKCSEIVKEEDWDDLDENSKMTALYVLNETYNFFRDWDPEMLDKSSVDQKDEIEPTKSNAMQSVSEENEKLKKIVGQDSSSSNSRDIKNLNTDFEEEQQKVEPSQGPSSEELDVLKQNVFEDLGKLKIDNSTPNETKPKDKSIERELPAPKKSENVKKVVCDNEACANTKKLYLQERNNRTIAEGELKQNKAKMDEWKKLKKEEEKWKMEKRELEKRNKNMEKEIKILSSQAEENKKLREKVAELEMENLRLTSSNERMKTSHGKLEREFNSLLEEKREQYQKLEEANTSNLKLRKEKQALLEENQQLNGPISKKTDSVEEKRRWHEKLREEFNQEEVLNGIRNMTAVLEERTPEFQALREIEERRLETAADLYSRVLDYNLLLLEDTNSNIGLLPVPPAPDISARFATKFKEEMKNQFPDPEDEVGLSMEKSCYICFEPFTDKQKIYECKRFSKHIVCRKCGDKIMTEGRGVCGHCEGALKIAKYEIARFQ